MPTAKPVSRRHEPRPGHALRKLATAKKPKAKYPTGYVPNRLRQLRERHKDSGGFYLTIAEVAKLLNVSESTVARHESDTPSVTRGLNEADVIAYARIYKVQTHELFDVKLDTPKRRTS